MIRLLAVPVVAVLVVGLAGCGSDVPSSTAGGPVVTDAQGLTATDQAAPQSVARAAEPTPVAPSTAAPATAAADGSVTFAGVTVRDALDPAATPQLTSSASAPAPGLLVQDLVVGTGAAAGPTSAVVLHYSGVLYADGTGFDANYDDAAPEPEQLSRAVAGFAQGVGGTDGVAPMRVGGRRLMIFPASLGYGAVPQGPIPAHASLVFVVDLLGL